MVLNLLVKVLSCIYCPLGAPRLRTRDIRRSCPVSPASIKTCLTPLGSRRYYVPSLQRTRRKFCQYPNHTPVCLALIGEMCKLVKTEIKNCNTFWI